MPESVHVLVKPFYDFAFDEDELNEVTLGVFTPSVVDGPFNVTAATNANPIAITTSVAHNLTTSRCVRVKGVLGNTAANGVFLINVTGTTTFTLTGSVGNGAYVSGGTVNPVNSGLPHSTVMGCGIQEADMLAVNSGVVVSDGEPPPTPEVGRNYAY